jgi:hypothetical protein
MLCPLETGGHPPCDGERVSTDRARVIQADGSMTIISMHTWRCPVCGARWRSTENAHRVIEAEARVEEWKRLAVKERDEIRPRLYRAKRDRHRLAEALDLTTGALTHTITTMDWCQKALGGKLPHQGDAYMRRAKEAREAGIAALCEAGPPYYQEK